MTITPTEGGGCGATLEGADHALAALHAVPVPDDGGAVVVQVHHLLRGTEDIVGGRLFPSRREQSQTYD